ncbi:MAG: NAD(P)/FAD-dependent oxidoreductase [Candidatus Ranarchaeia archaeon]|jgi:geranylgeranyl reductase family protein
MGFEVAVVGAGPAGSTAAFLLAKRGIKVGLFEKNKMPRRKPCGGALSQRAIDLLKELKLSLPSKIIQKTVTGFRLVRPDGKSVVCDLGRPVAHLVLREEFDSFLYKRAKKAGVLALEERKITKAVRIGNKISLMTDVGGEYLVDMVVAADGANGNLARLLGIRSKWPKDQIRSAVEMEPEIDPRILSKAYPTKHIHMHFGKYPHGYAWVFPKRDRVSIGLGGLVTEVSNLKKQLQEFIKTLPITVPPETKVSAGIIPLGGIRRPLTNDRVILIGDAAGFVDPFTEEGIYHAIMSAKIATDVIQSALKTGKVDHESLLRYEQESWDVIGNDLNASRKFAKALYSRVKFYVNLVSADPKVLEEFLKIQEGKNTYQDFYKYTLVRSPLLFLRDLASRMSSRNG